MDSEKELGRFIKRARKARNLKLRQVADAIGKSPQYICDIEKGRRGQNMHPLLAVKLAEFLNVPIAAILNRAGVIIDENEVKYKQILRLTRNNLQSTRILNTFSNAYDAIERLKTLTEVGSPAKKLVQTLGDLVRELDSALSDG